MCWGRRGGGLGEGTFANNQRANNAAGGALPGNKGLDPRTIRKPRCGDGVPCSPTMAAVLERMIE